MKLIGLDLGPNRTPFRNMTDEEEASMKQELEAIGFFERCNTNSNRTSTVTDDWTRNT